MADVYAADASDIDITQIFQSFGYTPTQAEAESMAGAFGGANNAATKAAGVSAIGQYVNYQNQVKQAEANDPLTALQTRMNNIIDQNTASVKGLSAQLQSTLAAAPQLFGSLTPDQIQTYLAPMKTAFDSQMASVQSTMASRGLGAGSTEANALAQTGEQFNQTVLQTGLNIGLTSQQNQANALQSQINNLFGQTSQAMSVSGAAAGQQSSQNLGESNLIASLPSFLNAQSLNTGAYNTAATKGTTFMDTFNEVTSAINMGTNTATNLMGKQGLQGIIGGAPSNPQPYSSGGTNPMMPSAASTSMGGANYQNPNLSLFQGTPGTAAAYGMGSEGSAASMAGSGSLFGGLL